MAPPRFPARALTLHGISDPHFGGPLAELTLDGADAAYVVVGTQSTSCPLGEHVYRWDLASGRSKPVSGHPTCLWGQSSTGRGIDQIAVSGARTAWLLNEGGNTESDEFLYASTSGPGKETLLARSTRMGDYGETYDGTWVGGLVSDGSRISYSTWTTISKEAVTTSALARLSGARSLALAQGSGAVLSASADSGRVAILRLDGTVALYGIEGQLLQTITPASPEAVALSGELVAVLTKRKTVEVYDRRSGALLHGWPIAGGERLWLWPIVAESMSQFDASDGIAVYVTGGSVRAIDLTTGKSGIVASEPDPIVNARIDQAGLLYGYNTSEDTGKLVFVPFTRIAKLVGR